MCKSLIVCANNAAEPVRSGSPELHGGWAAAGGVPPGAEDPALAAAAADLRRLHRCPERRGGAVQHQAPADVDQAPGRQRRLDVRVRGRLQPAQGHGHEPPEIR
jgi:hypothetical protein